LTEQAAWLAAPVVTYLVGAIPFALLIGFVFGVDLRRTGSGNVGAGNLTRVAGFWAGTIAALLDGLKGLVPVLAMQRMGAGPTVVSVSGLAVVAGHNWSIYLRGRSGRGLAPSAGVMVGIQPLLMLWTGSWAALGWRVGGGLGGFFGWAALPVVAVIFRLPTATVLASFGLAVLMLARRMQGNPNKTTGARAAIYRAVFDRDPAYEEGVAAAEEPAGS
jgi:glycerol-3-phosphate acyltransferase PlsY